MKQFVAIDFETANPKRVSACAIGYTIVQNGVIVESNGFLMKPIGGHAPFQTKIHGISNTDTGDKPDFGTLYSSVAHLFELPIVGHSMFDKQVLKALSDHFELGMRFEYTDSAALAKQTLPDLQNYKLKTLAKHFQLPRFKHHDATDDAKACAAIFLHLQDTHISQPTDSSLEFESLATAILDDDRVDYKEAYQLMYWLEDHRAESSEMDTLLSLIRTSLADDILEEIEGEAIHGMLKLVMHNRRKRLTTTNTNHRT
jgi:DNA polymerase-3 subunit epsilon